MHERRTGRLACWKLYKYCVLTHSLESRPRVVAHSGASASGQAHLHCWRFEIQRVVHLVLARQVYCLIHLVNTGTVWMAMRAAGGVQCRWATDLHRAPAAFSRRRFIKVQKQKPNAISIQLTVVPMLTALIMLHCVPSRWVTSSRLMKQVWALYP